MSASLLLTTGSEDPAIWLVCLLGPAIVFAGLICLIGIVYATSFVLKAISGSKEGTEQEISPAPAPVVSTTVQNAPIENRSEIVAAICAAIAEANGTDISAIRVVSLKKL